MAVHNHTENVVPTPLTNNNLVLLCSEIERQMCDDLKYTRYLGDQEALRQIVIHVANQYLPAKWQTQNPSTDADWDEYNYDVHQAAQAAQAILDSHMDPEFADVSVPAFMQFSETPLQRFAVISTASSPQPWFARQALHERGVEEGDASPEAHHRRYIATGHHDLGHTDSTIDLRPHDHQEVLAVERPNGQVRVRRAIRRLRRAGHQDTNAGR